MTTMPESIKRAIWEGFRNVGILNGIPADAYTPNVTPTGHTVTVANDPDKAMACFRGSDGSEFWRHVGLGSV